jgi:hypothetical protein
MSDPVGYGKPPKATQFKKGRSGNPAGRPKGKLNVATVVQQALSAPVVVNEGGRRVVRTKFEISMTQLANQAAGGDLHAIRMLLPLASMADADGHQGPMSPDLKADRELALKFVARMTGLNPKDGADGANGSTAVSTSPAQPKPESSHE